MSEYSKEQLFNTRENEITETFTIGVKKQGEKIQVIDLSVFINDKNYVLSVASKDYLEFLAEKNKAIVDPDEQDEDNMLPVNTIKSTEEVLRMLRTKKYEDLKPYLTEQINIDTSNTTDEDIKSVNKFPINLLSRTTRTKQD